MLLKLEPYGMGNSKPVFSVMGLRIANIAQMGIDNKHIRLRLTSQNKYINAVGFNMGSYFDYFKPDDIVDIAFIMEVNSYMGNEQVQLQLKDIRLHEDNRE
jgi:single-stranded-DNA-specific exonuclease